MSMAFFAKLMKVFSSPAATRDVITSLPGIMKYFVKAIFVFLQVGRLVLKDCSRATVL